MSASILPFIFGSLIERKYFNFLNFTLGLLTVVCAHLSANLINDYADSRSGADWQDIRFYKFFGGSKLIQEKIFNEKFYLKTALFFLVCSFSSVVLLGFSLGNVSVIGIYLAIIFLAWSYSVGPFKFSYHRMGEIIIIFLFGPVLVMGGYFIQTKIFPSLLSFLLSLPCAFLIAAILFANEIPDYFDDVKVGKFTWAGIFGLRHAFLVYYALIFSAFFFICLDVVSGYLKPNTLLIFIFIFLAVKAGNILRLNYTDKIRLIESSRLTIALHLLVNVALIGGLFI